MAAPASRAIQDRHFVAALARGLDVLACFRAGDHELGNQEIAQRCALPKSTVSRLTHTLTRLDYLVQDVGSSKYRLGPAAMALGQAPLLSPVLRAAARGPMQELADATGAEVALGVRTRLVMTYAEHCHSSLIPRSPTGLGLGARLALATSAIGLAWLAVQADDVRRDLTAQMANQRARNARAVEDGVAQAVADYRTLGVVRSFGNWRGTVNAIARPLRLGAGLPALAMNCGGPAIGLSTDFLLSEARPRLIETVSRIEAAIAR